MVSIKDVAKEAGVSATTVSAVVNGLDCVKPSTRERVLEAIDRLGYIPNVSARELVTRKKQNIGLITMTYDRYESRRHSKDGSEDIFYTEYILKIAECLENMGYGLLLENFYYESGSKRLPKLIVQKRVDGVIVVGSLYTKEFIKLLRKYIPAVVALGCPSEFSDYVRNDYTESVTLPIRYLIANGHRRIAYASGDPLTRAYHYKLLGYKMALEEAGIPYREDYVFESKYLATEGYCVARKIMELPEETRPTAVMFASDIIAAGAYQYFYENRIRIPDEISVVGYENLPISCLLCPPLTSVDWHKDRMSEEACNIMLKRLEKSGGEQLGIVIPCNIVERSSVRKIE